jgi:hypothetical protein
MTTDIKWNVVQATGSTGIFDAHTMPRAMNQPTIIETHSGNSTTKNTMNMRGLKTRRGPLGAPSTLCNLWRGLR